MRVQPVEDLYLSFQLKSELLKILLKITMTASFYKPKVLNVRFSNPVVCWSPKRILNEDLIRTRSGWVQESDSYLDP